MPYHIGKEGSYGCDGYPVIKDIDGTVMGCHKTEDEAKKQLAALYANEPEASKEEKSTMSNLTTSYFGIEKADRNADGTLTVYGKATDDALDIDQQICDADWLERAMPNWFKSGGNIREQHSNIAAGVAKQYESKADGHYISALVVDPVSVKKVETGVLKGFSIGIKNPRVTRDKVAANGRIVDGQIVEVSLVDRPANPNCQLVLAKSASGEATLIQVEDLIEKNLLQSDDTNLLKEANMKKASDIIELAKSLQATDVVKFDQATYDTARNALAQLIQIEAKEMETEGSDEQNSIAQLLEAVHHLMNWYQGEKLEGEVMEEVLEMSADKDSHIKSTVGCDCAGCEKCGKAGGCDSKMCKGHDSKSMMKTEEEKSVDTNKCLECGCHKPEESHGGGSTVLPDGTTTAHMSTADIVAPNETPKSAEADETPTEETVEEKDSADKKPAEIEAIVEQVVESATKALKTEIASLVSAKEAAETKAISLESELAIAKSQAVAGGPKRTAKPVGETSNDLFVKSATYREKAKATTDPTLAKGYKQLADEFLAKATEATSK